MTYVRAKIIYENYEKHVNTKNEERNTQIRDKVQCQKYPNIIKTGRSHYIRDERVNSKRTNYC